MINKNIKVLFLYSELVSYNFPIFEFLVKNYNAFVYVVCWDKKLLKPMKIPSIEGVEFKTRSSFVNTSDLVAFVSDLNVDIIYISGWMDYGYLRAVYSQRKKGVPIVAGIDDKWKNSLRQFFGAFVVKNIIKRFFISNFWVSGPQQYEFAKNMGYSDNEIIFDLLAIDFDVEFQNCSDNFIYVGNFREVKGFDILVNAFKIYRKRYNGHWGLICIGSGELQSLAENIEGIKLYPFSSKEEIIQLSKNASVMVLPSRNDMWGVVVQEFVSLGKALILSENVGARSTYLINNFNGRLFFDNSPAALATEMNFFSSLDKEELNLFMSNSLKIKNRATVETSCANLVSLIK